MYSDLIYHLIKQLFFLRGHLVIVSYVTLM